jgi:hypothetical protein
VTRAAWVCAGVSLAAGLALACSRADQPGVAGSADSAVSPVPAGPADSLVLALAHGGTVWYTLARDARAEDGTPCVERALEIRDGSRRVAVPLLYTRDIPIAAGDSMIEARLYLNCAPGARYRVSTRTGQPTPIR